MDIENIKDFKEFRLEVLLELLVTGKAVNFKCNEERFEISVGRIYFLGLWMPFKVQLDSLKAVFDCTSRKLVVTGLRKTEDVLVEPETMKLKPVSLSANDLLYDIF
jgi:PIH1 CS-like domain